MVQCAGQMSLMDLYAPAENEFKPGDWIEVENVGEQLTFDEITQMVNQLIIMDMSTVSHAWYKVVMVEQIVMSENNTKRRLVYYDGVKQRGLVSEMYFDETFEEEHIYDYQDCMDVIGNNFDNPELLEV